MANEYAGWRRKIQFHPRTIVELPGRAMGTTFTIFLVDDDASVLKALSRLLRARGYDVRAHASPLEFLASHDPTIPGCVVLDVSMPGLDGLELQRELTVAAAHRLIVFLTGKGSIPMSVQAMRAGAIDFLTKPVNDRDFAIIDDDSSVLKALARLLRTRALQAKTFASAREFLAALPSGVPECLILDLQMPEMSGLELHRHLTRVGIKIPTIFITAYDSVEIRQRCEAAGTVAYLLKPLQDIALFAAIERTRRGSANEPAKRSPDA